MTFVFTLFSLTEKNREWPCLMPICLIQIYVLFKSNFSKYFCCEEKNPDDRATHAKVHWIPKLSDTKPKLNAYSYITAMQYHILQCCNAFDIVHQSVMDIEIFVQYFERPLEVTDKCIPEHACVWTLAANFGWSFRTSLNLDPLILQMMGKNILCCKC